jgi:transglycosylase-like protein with SLT domain/putative peptidoglycan binding protein
MLAAVRRRFVMGRARAHDNRRGGTSRHLLCLLALVAASAWLAPPAAARVDPQVAGLQVALRAYSFYAGPIDGISGPETRRGIKRFQHRVGLQVDGRAGPATRSAFGPLGRPLFGKRTMRRGLVGLDVSVLQFLLARRGELAPISGYFDARTVRALRHFQRARRLAVDGVAGTRTLSALHRRAPQLAKPVLPGATTTASEVPPLLDSWAAHYGVDRRLVRAVAWMESGFQTDLTSPVGAWGVMQILPGTWIYVETVLIGRKVPRTASGNIRVGVAYLRQLLHEFGGNERQALAAWYQGPTSVRKQGAIRETKIFVANVLALRTTRF